MSAFSDGEAIDPVLSVLDQEPTSYTRTQPQPTTYDVTKKQFQNPELQYSKDDSRFQKHDNAMTPCIVQTPCSSSPEQPSQQNIVPKNEILRSKVKIPDTRDDNTTLGRNRFATHQTTGVQSASEDAVINYDDEATKADTSQNILEIQNKTPEAYLSPPNNEANLYREYDYPTTKISSRIRQRVAYYEKKLVENYLSTPTSYGKEIHPNYLPTSVSDASPSPRTKDAPSTVSNDLAENMTEVGYHVTFKRLLSYSHFSDSPSCMNHFYS